MSGYFPNIRYHLVNVGIKTRYVHYYPLYVGLIFYPDRASLLLWPFCLGFEMATILLAWCGATFSYVLSGFIADMVCSELYRQQ